MVVPSAAHAGFDIRSARGRGATLIAVIVAHLLIGVLLYLGFRSPAVTLDRGGSLQVFTLSETPGAPASPAAAEQRPEAAPEPKFSPVEVPAPIPPTTGGSVLGSTVGAAGAVGGGCAVAETIGRTIGGDPAALAALAALPPEVRTDADAVMLWNGEWLRAPAADGTDSLGVIRSIVEQSFATSTRECIEAAVAGPRFIPVALGNRTVMLVVGSGNWRWRDLLEPDSYAPHQTKDALDGAAKP